MDLSKFSLGDKILAGTSVGLVFGLLVLPWHSVSAFGRSYSRTALQSPNSFWGVLALLATLAVIGVTAVRLFSPDTTLPELPVAWPKAVSFASIAVVAVLAIKLVSETTALGFGAYLDVLLAGGMAYGAFVASKADESSPARDTEDSA